MDMLERALIAAMVVSGLSCATAQERRGGEPPTDQESAQRQELPADLRAREGDLCRAQADETREKYAEAIEKLNASFAESGRPLKLEIAGVTTEECEISIKKGKYILDVIQKMTLELKAGRGEGKSDFANVSACYEVYRDSESGGWEKRDCDSSNVLDSYNVEAIEEAINEGLLAGEKITITIQ